MVQPENEQQIGWTEFKRNETNRNPDVSVMGLMSLILNLAHEFLALQNVLLRSVSLAGKLGKKHVVVTADQTVYCKLVELR